MSRPAKIKINLAAIKANCALAQSLAPDSKTLAVVKADAYGHGAVVVAKALTEQVEMLTVACLDEALELRAAGIQNKILLLEGFFGAEELHTGIAQNCEFVVHNSQQVEQLLDAKISVPLKIWLKIDTGMHRLGLPLNKVQTVCDKLFQSNNVKTLVLMSHFSCADELENDFSQIQLARFTSLFTQLSQQYSQRFELSMANSAGILGWPASRLDWNRPGIMLYGLSPFSHAHNLANELKPAMDFTSEVIAIRTIDTGESVGYGHTWTASSPSVIATIATGYGDGYPRNAPSGTPVLVNGQRAKLVGRVSMDLICVDVTKLTGVQIGSAVELWGQRLSANEVAKWAGTIGYELVTRMPKRVARTYLET